VASAMRTHGTHPVACYCRSKLVRRDLRHIAGWSKDVIYQMIRPIRKFDYIVANAELENNIPDD